MTLKTIWAALPRAARIYVTVVGALAVAAVGTVTTVAASGTPLLAASPSPSPSANPGQQYCTAFTGHLASNLGKSPSQVQSAIASAISQTVNDAVKNGDLTQKQADAIKSHLGSSSQTCAGLPGRLGIGRRAGPGIGSIARGFGPGIGLNEYAKALGISQAQLQQDLKNGQTVKDIAASKGMDENAFRSKLVGVVKSDLDAQVKAGNLTQKQEDAIVQRLQNTSTPLPLWNGMPQRHPGMPGAKPGAPASPGAGTPGPAASPATGG